MKTLAILILALPVLAFGRIGESCPQCQERYGKMISSDEKSALFSKDGFEVMVAFRKSAAFAISFQKIEKNSDRSIATITAAEIEALMEANSGGKKWGEAKELAGGKEWATLDGTRVAYYKTSDHMLLIRIKADFEQFSKEEHEAQKAKMSGF